MSNDILETSTLKVEKESGFFALISSFFTNFLFNGFKWKDTIINF